jgi:hypothetical protein
VFGVYLRAVFTKHSACGQALLDRGRGRRPAAVLRGRRRGSTCGLKHRPMREEGSAHIRGRGCWVLPAGVQGPGGARRGAGVGAAVAQEAVLPLLQRQQGVKGRRGLGGVPGPGRPPGAGHGKTTEPCALCAPRANKWGERGAAQTRSAARAAGGRRRSMDKCVIRSTPPQPQPPIHQSHQRVVVGGLWWSVGWLWLSSSCKVQGSHKGQRAAQANT